MPSVFFYSVAVIPWYPSSPAKWTILIIRYSIDYLVYISELGHRTWWFKYSPVLGLQDCQDIVGQSKIKNGVWYLSKEVKKSNFRQYAEMEKQRWEESERRSQEVRRSEKRKSGKQEDAGARKGREVAIHCVFPMIWGSRGSKSNLAKAACAEPAGQMREEKLHAVVARSTFVSKKGKSTSRSDRFWKLSCRKSARRCGAKHISKSKCTKHTRSGPLLEVQLSKKCTPLWREAHFQVKMYKARGVWTTFGSWDVEKVQAVVARSTFPSQKCQKLRGSGHFLTLYTTLDYTTYTTLHYITLDPLHPYNMTATALH